MGDSDTKGSVPPAYIPTAARPSQFTPSPRIAAGANADQLSVFTTQLFEDRYDIRIVQGLLNHTEVSSTMMYTDSLRFEKT